MKFFKFIPIFNLISSVKPSPIPTQKICRDCKFFIANNQKCGHFPNVDLVTGKKSYNYASILRNNNDDCGTEGKYFKKNHYKIITVPYYFVLDWWWVVIPITIPIIQIISLIQK